MIYSRKNYSLLTDANTGKCSFPQLIIARIKKGMKNPLNGISFRGW